MSFLSTHPAVKPAHLASLHSVTGGAAPFGPALIEKFMEKAQPNVIKFREGIPYFVKMIDSPWPCRTDGLNFTNMLTVQNHAMAHGRIHIAHIQ